MSTRNRRLGFYILQISGFELEKSAIDPQSFWSADDPAHPESQQFTNTLLWTKYQSGYGNVKMGDDYQTP